MSHSPTAHPVGLVRPSYLLEPLLCGEAGLSHGLQQVGWQAAPLVQQTLVVADGALERLHLDLVERVPHPLDAGLHGGVGVAGGDSGHARVRRARAPHVAAWTSHADQCIMVRQGLWGAAACWRIAVLLTWDVAACHGPRRRLLLRVVGLWWWWALRREVRAGVLDLAVREDLRGAHGRAGGAGLAARRLRVPRNPRGWSGKPGDVAYY